MNRISIKAMVLLLSIALIISMIPVVSFAETSSPKTVDRAEPGAQPSKAPFYTILSRKLSRKEITVEKQGETYVTYSFNGNRKLIVFEDDDQISSNAR